MAGAKQEALKIVESLPDDVTTDDVLAELFFKTQVDAGLAELDAGKGVDHEAAKERLSKWLHK